MKVRHLRIAIQIAAFLVCLNVSPVVCQEAPPSWRAEGLKAALKDVDFDVRVFALREVLEADALILIQQSMPAVVGQLLSQLLSSEQSPHNKLALQALLKMPGEVPTYERQIRNLLTTGWSEASLAASILADAKLLRQEDVAKVERLFDPNRFTASIASVALKALQRAQLLTKEHGRLVAKVLTRTQSNHLDVADAATILLEIKMLESEDVEVIKKRLSSIDPGTDPTNYHLLASVIIRAGLLDDQVVKTLEGILRAPDPVKQYDAAQTVKISSELTERFSKAFAAELGDYKLDDWNALIQAIDFLGKGSTLDLSAVDKLVEDPDLGLVRIGIASLNAMGAIKPSHRAAAIQLLNNSDTRNKFAGASALIKLGSDPGLISQALFPLIKSTDNSVATSALFNLRGAKAINKAHLPTLKKLFLGSSSIGTFPLANAICEISGTDTDVTRKMDEILSKGPPELVQFAATVLSGCGGLSDDQVRKIAGWINGAEPLGTDSGLLTEIAKLGSKARIIAAKLADLLPVTRASDGLSGTFSRIENLYMHKLPMAALIASGPHDDRTLVRIMMHAHEGGFAQSDLTAFAYELSGGTEKQLDLVALLHAADSTSVVTTEDRRAKLATLLYAWNEVGANPHPMKTFLARRASVLTRGGSWVSSDVPTLKSWGERLKAAGFQDEAEVVNRELEKIVTLEKLLSVGRVGGLIFLSHMTFWVLLLLFYGRFKPVQAIFFWNPWVRKIGGLGYVGLLLTWVPFLRRQLLRPFADRLIEDANIGAMELERYFQKRRVRLADGSEAPIQCAVPEIRGQIVLFGDSGVGKSMHLRMICKMAVRPTVFLRAATCSDGPMKEIQKKLKGLAGDEVFLSQIIYAGALDVCIDALNEAPLSTLKKIDDFLGDFKAGNILVATQHFSWEPPRNARTCELQPLARDDIEEFLQMELSTHSEMSAEARGAQIKKYLKHALAKARPASVVRLHLAILSNPFDASIVARMLSEGVKPNLYGIVNQQISLALSQFQQKHSGSAFPEAAFASDVYQALVVENSDIALSAKYVDEMAQFAEQRIVVIFRAGNDGADRRWYFRHDRYRAWFLAKAMLADAARIQQHLGDPRFQNAYEILASLLPPAEAGLLREEFVDHAVVSNDLLPLQNFVRFLEQRNVAELSEDSGLEDAG